MDDLDDLECSSIIQTIQNESVKMRNSAFWHQSKAVEVKEY